MNSVDQFFLTAVNSIQHPLLTSLAYAVTYFASYSLIIFFFAFLLHRRDKENALKLFLCTLIDLVILIGLKFTLNRPRPFGNHAGLLMEERFNSSFPSGHTSRSFFLAPLLSSKWGKKVFWYSLAGLVAFSRIYLGFHHFTDVVAGMLIGTAVFWFVDRYDIDKRIKNKVRGKSR